MQLFFCKTNASGILSSDSSLEAGKWWQEGCAEWREELRASILSLVALVSEPSDGGALQCFWEQAQRALSAVFYLALLLNLSAFCLLHIRYSSPYTLAISKPWLRKPYSRSKSLKSLRVVKPISPLPMHQIWAGVSSGPTFCTTSLQRAL